MYNQFNFNSWTRQMGYPVLTVEKVKDRLYRLTQSRFLADPSKLGQGETSPFDYKWDIYVTYRQSTSPDTVESQWMKMEDGRLDISLPSETDWVKFNVDQAGFYRQVSFIHAIRNVETISHQVAGQAYICSF